MNVAYIDTSCLVALAFGESTSRSLARRLAKFDQLVASNLVEAELRSAFVREAVDAAPRMLDSLTWILPDRPLREEIARVLAAGYVRGADCWHLATALYLAEQPAELSFLTLDDRQQAVAAALGFRVR